MRDMQKIYNVNLMLLFLAFSFVAYERAIGKNNTDQASLFQESGFALKETSENKLSKDQSGNDRKKPKLKILCLSGKQTAPRMG